MKYYVLCFMLLNKIAIVPRETMAILFNIYFIRDKKSNF